MQKTSELNAGISINCRKEGLAEAFKNCLSQLCTRFLFILLMG